MNLFHFGASWVPETEVAAISELSRAPDGSASPPALSRREP
jgi:hypothetical protein